MTALVGRDDFGRQIRAEWTKLRSVRRWVFALAGAGVLTVILSLLAASGSGTDANLYPNFVTGPNGDPVADEFEFVHQRVSGDVTITARVVTQADSHEKATAGLMIKDGVRSGSRYAALALTPGNGVRLQADFTTDRYTGPGAAGTWLRLTRTGRTVTGHWSADGRNWHSAKLPTKASLPKSVDVGLFVSSPPRLIVERQAGSSSVGEEPTVGRATFDNVSIVGAPLALQAAEVRQATGTPQDSSAPVGKKGSQQDYVAGMTESGGVFTVTGRGKIGPNPPDDDIVQVSLFGVLAVVIVLAAVGALFMTSEFKQGMLRTTFTASPRRWRLLAAKAIVLGGVGFGIGLVSSVTALFVAQPLLRDRGWTLPAFPPPSVTNPAVLRALLTTSVFVAAVALLALGIATITRHSAAAIGSVVALVVLPLLVASALPSGAARLLMQLTPAGGFATQRAKPPTVALVDPSAMLSPWWGLCVVCVYAAAAMAGAWWSLRRRDT
jgi:regulation of enolase protein 1 (concanavalin A-like superfamily)